MASSSSSVVRATSGAWRVLAAFALCMAAMPGLHVLGQLTQAQKDTLLLEHNRYRRDVSPSACPPLPAMTWNDDLAALAQNWSQGCVFAIDPNLVSKQTTFTSIGENMYGRPIATFNLAQAISSWNSERSAFNLTANSCSGVCAHYTQIVWSDTMALGCGGTACSSGFNRGLFTLVCYYGPAGNVAGSAPYVACQSSGGSPALNPSHGYHVLFALLLFVALLLAYQ